VICCANSLFKFKVYQRHSLKTDGFRAGKEIAILRDIKIFIIVVTKARHWFISTATQIQSPT
jgi:hypothetical protein